MCPRSERRREKKNNLYQNNIPFHLIPILKRKYSLPGQTKVVERERKYHERERKFVLGGRGLQPIGPEITRIRLLWMVSEITIEQGHTRQVGAKRYLKS